MSKDVTKNENLPAELEDLLVEDSGLGQENMTKDDFAIPRLVILQSNSPQVNKRDGEYVEGAEASMLMENVTNRLFDGEAGVIVVPVSYRRTVIEWKLRESAGGGGFVADHGLDGLNLMKDCKKDSKGRLINEAGNQLVETAEYFAFYCDMEELIFQPCVISMSVTQMKKSKRWNTLMDQIRIPNPKGPGRIKPPIFYMSYLMTTVPESNDKGSWFGWSIRKQGAIINFPEGMGTEIYQAARTFKQQIDAGEVKVADPVDGGSDAVESEDDPM